MTPVTFLPDPLARLSSWQRADAVSRMESAAGTGLRAAFGAELPGTAVVLCTGVGQSIDPLPVALDALVAPLVVVTAAPGSVAMDALGDFLTELCPAASRWLVTGFGNAGAHALKLAARLPASLALAVLPKASGRDTGLPYLPVPPAMAVLAPPSAAQLWALEAAPWTTPSDWQNFVALPPVNRVTVPETLQRLLEADPARQGAMVMALHNLAAWSQESVGQELARHLTIRIEDIEQDLARIGLPGRLPVDRVMAAMVALVPIAGSTPSARIRTLVQALVSGHLADVNILHFAGVVSRDAGLTEDALEYFEEALVISPQFHYAATELGVLLSGLGDDVMAGNWLGTALELAPADRRAVSAAVGHALTRGRRHEALDILAAAARAAPDESWIAEEIARISP